MGEDLAAEIEKLKLKKIELTNKINIVNNFEEQEDLKRRVELIHNQIETLEKLGVKENG